MKEYNDVFISYGRKESKHFASRLHDQLSEKGFDVWFDQNDIPLAVDFQNQIDSGIEKADNFIFIIAPHALQSVYCLKEIKLAIKYNKRIIPILHIEPQTKEVWDKMHPTIGKINWIYFREKADYNRPLSEWEAIDDFNSSFQGLLNLLSNHRDYISMHTKVLDYALKWDRNHRTTNHLLIGKERLDAEKWMLSEFENEQPPCIPTDLQCEFICESKEYAYNNMSDIFLCYAKGDTYITTRIYYAFMRKGITTWTHRTDVKAGDNSDKVSMSGIETNSYFVFFISDENLQSEHSLQQLNYALELNKNIIPIQIEDVDKTLIPEAIKDITPIMIKVLGAKSFQRAFNDLYNQVVKDYEYYHQHKKLLVEAFKWQRNNKLPSLLLRDYNLQLAEAWLRIGLKRKEHRPTSLHQQFIHESVKEAPKTETAIFITCSRQDSDFGRKLNEELQLHGKTTWYAQENIDAATDLQVDIDRYIRTTANYLFVLSPQSVNSHNCHNELLIASRYHKRILLVQYQQVEKAQIPEQLQGILPIDFRNYRLTFHNAFSELLNLIDREHEFVTMHNVLLQKSLDWEKHQNDRNYLPLGKERIDAERWLKHSLTYDVPPCEPTALQCRYIVESKKNAEDQMTDVFLSYAYEDMVIASKVEKVLARHCITSADNTNIKTGVAFHTAIMKSIERADTFLFFISKRSVDADYCLEELSHALLFDKRIILISLEDVERDQLLEELQQLSPIELKKGNDQSLIQATSELLKKLNKDRDYFHQHKILLTKAFKWKRQKSNPSMLLRGHALERAKTWVKMGERRDSHQPAPLQEQFVLQSAMHASPTSDVFVSYDADDHDFATKINDLLQTHAKTTWFDQQNIPASHDYYNEVYNGIETADNFLIIISPQTIQSARCINELKHARNLNKRIIPIMYETVPNKAYDNFLGDVEFIDFRLKGKHFQTALSDLLRTIDTDREHVRSHNRWLQKAKEWEYYKKNKDQLLRGMEIEMAETWLNEAKKQQKEPPATELQIEFITASRQYANEQVEQAERQHRLELQQIEKQKQLAENYARKIQKLKDAAEKKAEQQRELAERYNRELNQLKKQTKAQDDENHRLQQTIEKYEAEINQLKQKIAEDEK